MMVVVSLRLVFLSFSPGFGMDGDAKFGVGNCPVRSEDDIPDALKALKDRPLYAEKWANFKMVGPEFLSFDFSLDFLKFKLSLVDFLSHISLVEKIQMFLTQKNAGEG